MNPTKQAKYQGDDDEDDDSGATVRQGVQPDLLSHGRFVHCTLGGLSKSHSEPGVGNLTVVSKGAGSKDGMIIVVDAKCSENGIRSVEGRHGYEAYLYSARGGQEVDATTSATSQLGPIQIRLSSLYA